MRKAELRAATLRRDKLTLMPKKRMQTAARFALAGLLAVAVVACGRQSPESLMVSAKEYLVKGDRNAAMIQLKNLLSEAPNNGEARLLLGEALLDAGDYISAEKELARALDLKQPHEKVLPLYVRALLSQGKNQAVVIEVGKYKLFNPPAVAATQTALGDAYVRLGDRSRASEAYAAAIVAVPGYVGARLGEARLIAGQGQLDEALRRTDELIAADGKLAEARGLRADILLAKGDREGAKKALEEAIAARDRYLPARLTLIGMLTEERDLDGATKLIESTRKLAPGDLQLTYLDASLAFRKGDQESARQQVQQALKAAPNHVPSLVLAGAIEIRSKQFVLAEEHLRQAVARAPNHLGARRMLAATQLQMGQPSRARETLRPLLEKGIPRDAQLLLLAGETYLANGDVKRATAMYQAAASLGTEQGVAARTRLGQIALATGKVDEGFKELEAVSELDAGQYQADLALIAGHLRRNEIDKAMSAVQSLEKKQPTNPLTFQLYGAVNLARRDVPAARRSFEKALELQANYLPAAYSLGLLDMEAKRPGDARKRYEAMIAKDDKNDQLRLALADLLTRTGAEPKLIGETLQRAVSANSQSAPAWLALINFHLRNKSMKAALVAAQSAVAAMPNDPSVLDATGMAQEYAGEINQAIETYNKLAALQPRSVQPLYRLAALHSRRGDTDRVIESLRRVQKIAPEEREVVPQLAQVYVAASRHDDALKEARALQKREPQFAGGYSLEGDIWLAQRRFSDAERLYRQALKLEPKANAVAARLHGTLLAAGKSSEADAWAKKWIVENPRDAAMRVYLGERELAAKNLKAAAAHFEAALAIDPNNARVLNNLAWIGGVLGDARALNYAERALKLAPDDAAILDTYGVLLLKRGEAEKSLSYLERASKLEPTRNEIRLNYAKALIGAGRPQEARKELEALQGQKGDFPGRDEAAGLLKGL